MQRGLPGRVAAAHHKGRLPRHGLRFDDAGAVEDARAGQRLQLGNPRRRYDTPLAITTARARAWLPSSSPTTSRSRYLASDVAELPYTKWVPNTHACW
jgi:hypothetical protein